MKNTRILITLLLVSSLFDTVMGQTSLPPEKSVRSNPEKINPQTQQENDSNVTILMKQFPEGRRNFVSWILNRASTNRENVAGAILATPPDNQRTAFQIVSQIPVEELLTLDQASLITLIDMLTQAISNVPQDQKDQLTDALFRAGPNRQSLLETLKSVKPEHAKAAFFLIVNMPDRDLLSLKQEFLTEQIELAYTAWEQCPWRQDIPEQIFLQYILPYAHLNERRDNWRLDFMERLKKQAWTFKTPVEATIWLNNELNDRFNVYFHATKRPKPDQSPYESIEAGYASCTGLSILMADCCRSVGIPARIVGVPLWTKVEGNHNWVEIWDGQWYNVGSTGSDPRNDDWVNERCESQTDPDNWMHSVYAACFRRTNTYFPLVWDMEIRYVPALNVTRFYSQRKEVKIDIPNEAGGTVQVSWAGEMIASKSGERSVSFSLATGCWYQILIITDDGKQHEQSLHL